MPYTPREEKVQSARRQAVVDSRDLAALENDIRAMDAEIARLRKQREGLEERLAAARLVTAVVDGFPLSYGVYVQGRPSTVVSVPFEGGRWATVYENDKNGGNTFGLSVYDPGESVGDGTWRGNQWPSYEAAWGAACEWVVRGTLPEKK